MKNSFFRKEFAITYRMGDSPGPVFLALDGSVSLTVHSRAGVDCRGNHQCQSRMTAVRRWPAAEEARDAGIGLHTKNDDHRSHKPRCEKGRD